MCKNNNCRIARCIIASDDVDADDDDGGGNGDVGGG